MFCFWILGFLSEFGIWVFLFTQDSFWKVVTHSSFFPFSRTSRMWGVKMRMRMSMKKKRKRRRRREKSPKAKRQTVWRTALGPTGTLFPTANMAISLKPTQLPGHSVLWGLLEARVASPSITVAHRSHRVPQFCPSLFLTTTFPPPKMYLTKCC